MNLLKLKPPSLTYYKLPPQNLPQFSQTPSSFFNHAFSSPPSPPISLRKKINISNRNTSMWNNEVESVDLLRDYDDLAIEGAVYKRTLRLVECSMFAAVAGLAYFLSNSLSIENYFGCFFALPIVISSMRWGLSAGRKTMVATAMLLLTLSGPVKASTYLLMHGVVGLAMGTLWRLGANWGVSVAICTFVLSVPLSLSFSNLLTWFYPFHCTYALIGRFVLYTGSSNGCSRICSTFLIPNKRKHTCSDYYKHSCLSHIFAHSHRCKYSSIYECNICYIWNTALAQLRILCILAPYSLCYIFRQTRDERFTDTAKMVGKSTLSGTVAICCFLEVYTGGRGLSNHPGEADLFHAWHLHLSSLLQYYWPCLVGRK